MAWNPNQYLKFAQPRFRPAQDLLARVAVGAPTNVYDLGCGAGSTTQLLAARWPDANITGADSSAEMIAEAAKTSDQIAWRQQSAADCAGTSGRRDLQQRRCTGCPSTRSSFPHLMDQLAPGGVLAAQMPRNFGAPSHTRIWETVDFRSWS